MNIVRKDYEIIMDNTFNISIELEGCKINIEEIYFTIKKCNKNVVVQKRLNNGISFKNNIILIKVEPELTYDLKEDLEYMYDVKIIYNGKCDKETILYGYIKTKKFVTLPEDEV